MNTYNHIYGLSISGLQFFTIYAPGVRPNMTYFSFTPDILNGETHQRIYQEANNKDLAHDFTYIHDIVKTGCVASLDVLAKSTSNGGKKTGHVWLCIFNLGILVLQTLLKQGLKKFVKWYLSYYSDNTPHEPQVDQQP